ncbi:MAG TPA: hypothetical protein VJ984_07845 [Xanthomonadales bacterium]|nr:hypothetical protein [Xanthomonadales bacterium]
MPDTDKVKITAPLTIKIVAWMSIALGAFFLITYGLSGYLLVTSPAVEEGQNFNPGAFLGWSVSPAAFWTLVMAVPLVLVVDGIFLLKGKNWARMLAVFWWTFSFLSLLYTYGFNSMTMIQSAFCLLVIYFLNTRPAVVFFKGKPGT